MRPESRTKVNVRQTIIGGPKGAICIPLVAKARTILLDQADNATHKHPDLLEWRVDSYSGVENMVETLDVLGAMRTAIGEIPLIFTCRIHSEGGARPMPQEHRLDLIISAIRSGHVDVVDIELRNGEDFIEAVKNACQEAGTPLMLSYHDFQKTPEQSFICDRLIQARYLGADIAKIAVMPDDYSDVLTLMNATLQARTRSLEIPIVTMAMGEVGGISRIAGGLFGSDITFAIGEDASAPGQIPIDRLRQAMDVVYNL